MHGFPRLNEFYYFLGAAFFTGGAGLFLWKLPPLTGFLLLAVIRGRKSLDSFLRGFVAKPIQLGRSSAAFLSLNRR